MLLAATWCYLLCCSTKSEPVWCTFVDESHDGLRDKSLDESCDESHESCDEWFDGSYDGSHDGSHVMDVTSWITWIIFWVMPVTDSKALEGCYSWSEKFPARKEKEKEKRECATQKEQCRPLIKGIVFTWVLPHKGCLAMLITGLKQLSP